MKPTDNSIELELVVFDIAGTTVQDNGFVERAFLRVSDRYALGLDSAWIKSRMGVHKLAVMREAIEQSQSVTTQQIDATPEELSECFERMIEHEVENGSAPAIPGANQLIKDLQCSGVKVAFTTGFSRATAEAVLIGAGLQADTLVASDEVDRGRPAPDIVLEAMKRVGVSDPYRIAVVGDTPSDLGSGTSAQARLVIGIGHGTHELHDLADYPHTNLVTDLEELREVLGVVVQFNKQEPQEC